MRKYIRRMALAFLFSAACFVTTWILFGKDGGLSNRSGREPIAKLLQSFNEVQRKPLGKMMWEAATQGEDLFAGEDIRTSAASTAKIFLTQSKTVIELDPDSTIRLEQNPDGLALNFLEGNMLVKGSGTGLTLKSGTNNISLNNTDLALSKTGSGALDLEVLKGQAQLTQNGKATTIDNTQSGLIGENGLEADKTRIRVTSPMPGEPVFIDPGKSDGVAFQWEKLPEGYDVYIERGETRSDLKRFDARHSDGAHTELTVPTKIGKHYFRIVAIARDGKLPTMSSKVLPLEVSAKSPPALLEPAKEALVVLDAQQPKLSLKWAARAPFESLLLEIANDSALKNGVQKLEITNAESQREIDWKDSGEFFWRMTGFIRIHGKLEAVSSPVLPFTVKIGVDLVPPKLKSPMPDQHLTFQQVSTQGLFLSWERVAGIERYKMVIEKKGETNPAFEKEVVANPLRLTEFKPGAYSWSMASIDDDGKLSAFSEKRRFTIEEMPRIEWLDGNGLTEFLYFTEKPSFSVAWNKSGEAVSSYRVRWAKENELSEQTPWMPASQPMFSSAVPSESDYEVEVEGLNKEGLAVARSSIKTIRVRTKPLLPAPNFAADLPETLKADRKGAFSLAWTDVKGASKYRVSIRSEDGGSVVQSSTVERTVASLNKMKPGRYKVSLSSLDEHQRPGPESPARVLEVPETSDIRAPKIKQFKVK